MHFFAALSSSMDAPPSSMSRSSLAFSLSFSMRRPFMLLEAMLLFVSGITVLGATPYFLTRLTSMSHCPASGIILERSHITSLPSRGSFRVSMTFSRK